MRYVRWTLSVLAVLLVLLSGCTSSESGDAISGVSQGDAAKLNAQRSAFDTAADPPFTAETWFAAGQLAESQTNVPKAIGCYRSALQLDAKHLPNGALQGGR